MYFSNPTRRKVPPSTLCRRLDIKPQNYFNWAAAGMLADGKGGCTLLEGLEFAAFATLVGRLNYQRVKKPWPPLRPELRRHLAAGTVFVIYDEAAETLSAAITLEEVGRQVSHGGAVRVFSLEEAIAKIRAAFLAGSGTSGRRRRRSEQIVTPMSKPIS